MKTTISRLIFSGLLCLGGFVQSAAASDRIFIERKRPVVRYDISYNFGYFSRINAPIVRPTYAWMSSDVGQAFTQGYTGAGTSLLVVDTYNSSYISGNLTGMTLTQAHGYWTSSIASLIAPDASLSRISWNSTQPIQLGKTGLNTINLSYGLMASAGLASVQFDTLNKSIVGAANGSAVVVKAAGNDSVSVLSQNKAGQQDYLNIALANGASAIYAGALDKNGSPTNKAQLAWYSNFAGSDLNVQQRFLSVGVAGNLTNLYGTSFAAPILSGYSSILGSKFRSSTPTQIANQLLATARTDTLVNYSPDRYGKGEASLSRALAPATIR